MQSTRVLKVVIESGSAKVREGVPEDSVADMKDQGTLDSVWTGVLPLYEQFGEPVPGPYNEVKKVPEHVVSYRQEVNRRNKEYAVEAAGKDAPIKRKERDEGEEE